MRGGNIQRAQYVEASIPSNAYAAPNRRRPAPERDDAPERPAGRQTARKSNRTNVYRRRRMLAGFVILLGILALILAAFVQTPGATERALPIDPNNAGPDAVLAQVAGVTISNPVRPEDVTGLGYHPEGDSLVEMSPRGKNLSGNPVLRLFMGDSTPEKIQYYLMDPARRQGPRTGALDIGAEAGTPVYAPVSGTVTAIRPDPVLQKDASVVEIKPADNPDLRISISLVQDIDSEVGPKSPVTAGITELGKVADSGKVLKPQLAQYTSGDGNHVTVSASQTNR